MAEGSGGCYQVELRRMDTSQPWGFRLKGGVDQGIPLHVEQCGAKGRAYHAGLRPGDYVISICGMSVQNLTHAQIKQEVLRAGNEIDFVVQRGEQTSAAPVPAAAAPPAAASQPRVEVCEEPTMKIGGPTYKQVQPKTYQVIKQELDPNQQQTGSAKPASIFDRKRQERSGYLHAKGSTIQKAFGES